jgi:hypothetical protein
MRRYWPRIRREDSVSSLFGGTRWLFADVMLLAIVTTFLLATTVGRTPPAAKPHPQATVTPTSKPVPASTPTPTPTPAKTTQSGPALDLHYVPVTLQIDPSAPSATGIRQALLANPRLKGRRAGLVILFGGGSVSGPWLQLDNQVWKILSSVTPLFSGAADLPYWNGSDPSSQFLLHIYLFKDT